MHSLSNEDKAKLFDYLDEQNVDYHRYIVVGDFETPNVRFMMIFERYSLEQIRLIRRFIDGKSATLLEFVRDCDTFALGTNQKFQPEAIMIYIKKYKKQYFNVYRDINRDFDKIINLIIGQNDCDLMKDLLEYMFDDSNFVSSDNLTRRSGIAVNVMNSICQCGSVEMFNTFYTFLASRKEMIYDFKELTNASLCFAIFCKNVKLALYLLRERNNFQFNYIKAVERSIEAELSVVTKFLWQRGLVKITHPCNFSSRTTVPPVSTKEITNNDNIDAMQS
jgi:hypothetical protein